jgi:amino acid transporter
VAGVALLTDYVMTVAVSTSAGTAAMYSQFPSLFAHRIAITIAFVWLIAWVNLRGIRMTGRLFATPTYLFLLSMVALLVVGAIRAAGGGLNALPPPAGVTLPPETTAVGLFVLLHAYASGPTVEAISNGVSVFRPPEWRNATVVLAWMGAILALTFGGITLLAYRVHPIPTEKTTLVSELGRAVFGTSPLGGDARLGLQVMTTGILVLAANTSFSDFPRLASFHAGDGYLPRTLRRRGRRLVFSTGILTLTGVSTVIVVAAGADVHRLVPLYAVGVFASFTFSQAGMTRRHWRLREEGWRRSLLINAAGTIGSGFALLAVSVAKFGHGAWIVLLVVPLVLGLFIGIHEHYARADQRLESLAHTATDDHVRGVVVVRSRNAEVARALHYAASLRVPWVEIVPPRARSVRRVLRSRAAQGRVLVVDANSRLRRRLTSIPGIAFVAVNGCAPPLSERHVVLTVVTEHAGLGRRALALARALRPDDLRAVVVDLDPDQTARIIEAWRAVDYMPLEVLPAPYREPAGPLRCKVESLQADGFELVSIVISEVHPRWWQRPLHYATARDVRRRLTRVPHVAVVEDPYPI